MATNDELQEQLALTQKLNRVVESMARSISTIEASYQTQVSYIEKINSVLGQISVEKTVQEVGKLEESIKKVYETLNDVGMSSEQNLQKVIKNAGEAGTEVKTLNQSLTDNASKLKNVGDQSSSIDEISDALKDSAMSSKGLNQGLGGIITTMKDKFPAAVLVGAAALTGLWQGVKNVTSLTRSVVSFFGSIASGAASIAVSILSIPLKIFTGIVDLAASASMGMQELMQEVENVRKAFGDLRGPTSSAIREIHSDLSGFSDTGLSSWRVFGTLAERLAAIRESTEALGAVFDSTRDEWIANGGALLAFQKGLGITVDQMKVVGQRAIIDGKSMSSFLLTTTKQTLGLGQAFGISQKVIGKDMAKAFENMSKFAQLSVKEIGIASVYARKLGVELDKIVGTLDAFETFDSAAENAAKLTQSFGVQVDAFKLMEAQSPAEQIDMLRKSFREAGVDAAAFSRQQLKLLTSTTGLDEATAKQVFSLSNQGASLDDIKKKSEVAEKKQLTQAEAMNKLADSIERMVKSVGEQSGSFFDMFFKGVGRGLQSSEDFRGTIMNIKLALQQVFYVGVQLGRILPNIIPGMGEVLKGMREFFNPATFKSLAQGASSAISDFFKGNKSLPEALADIKERFSEFFAVQGPLAKKIYTGFKKMFSFAAGVVTQSIPLIADKIKDGIVLLTNFIRDPKAALAAAGSAGSSEFGFFANALLDVAKALKGAADVVWPAMKELIGVLFDKLVAHLKSDEVKNLLWSAAPVIAGMLVGPAVTRALAASLTASLATSAMDAFKNAFGRKSVADAASAGISSVMDAAAKTPKAGKAVGAASQAAAVTQAAAPGMSGKGAGWGATDAVRMGLKLVALAGALAVGGIMVATAVIAMNKILRSGGINTPSDAATPLIVMGAMVAGAVPLAFSLNMISKTGSIAGIMKGGLLASAAVGIVGLVGAGVTALLTQSGNPSQLVAAGKVMGAMTGVFLGMVPLIFGAMALGALAMGPQAIALGAAAIGMGIITTAVLAVAGASSVIITELTKLPVTPGFQQKIDAFLGVMNSIQAFTDSLVSVVKISQPSFTEIVFGGPTFVQKIGSATTMIESMIKGKDGRGGVMGIINIAKDSIMELGSRGPEVVRGAEVFGNIMGAVTGLLTAMRPPDALIEAGTGFIQQLTGAPDPFDAVMVSTTNYMKRTKGIMVGLMSEAIDVVNKLTTISIPEDQVQSAQTVGKLFNSVVTMMQGLLPPPSIMEKFVETTKRSVGLLGFESEVKKFDADGLTRFVSTMMDKMKSIIPLITNNVLSDLTRAASKIPAGQLDTIQSLGTIIGSIAGLVSGLAESTKGANVNVGNVDGGALVKVVQNVPSIATVLDQLKTTLPGLLNSLMSVVSTMPNDGEFMKSLTTTEKLFQFIGELPGLAATLAKGGSQGGTIDNDQLVQSIASMAVFLSRISVGGGAFGTSRAPLVELVSTLNLPVFDQLAGSSSKSVRVADNINKLMQGMTQTAKGTHQMVKEVGKIETGAMAMAVTAVQEMVTKANELENILSNESLNKVNVPARLKTLAKGVGLGSSGRYQIHNKDVQITINLSVSMDADDLEKTLIMRKKSIIRDRLNFATQNPSDRSADTIPDTVGPVNFPTGGGVQ